MKRRACGLKERSAGVPPACSNNCGQDARAPLDETDRILARHYGLTDEELDFIINYDIKYRMGRDGGEEE